MYKNLLLSCLCAAPALALATVETKMPAPHESIASRFDALRRNNLRGVMQAALSRQQMDAMRDEWDKNRSEPLDPVQTAQFAAVMEKLTAPGAEQALMAELLPKLEELRPQMQMMVGMFTGMAASAVQQDDNLSGVEKRQATQMITAIGDFLGENDITDERSARRAVAVVCTTARRLRLSSLEDVQKLSFDQALSKGDVLLKGFKDLFDVYGISFDQWIDSLEFETLNQTAGSATVKVSYKIFDIEDSFEHEVVREGHRWVDAK